MRPGWWKRGRSPACCGGLTTFVLTVGSLLGCAHGDSPTRKVEVAAWDTVWHTNRVFMDSVLPSPSLMSFNRDVLYVFDDALLRLAALEATTGRLLWRVGRLGQGPGEFAGVGSILPTPGGGVGIVDLANRRLTLVSASGAVSASISLAAMGSQPNQVCASADRFLVADAFQPFLQVMDSAGAPTERLLPIWHDLVGTGWESRQVMLRNDETASKCLVALFSGRGFAILTPDGGKVTVPYVETFDVFGTGARRDEGTMAFWATVDASFDGDTVLIHFAGKTADKYRLIDRYDANSGAYLGSARLPFRSPEIASGRGLVFAVDSGGLEIVALRARP